MRPILFALVWSLICLPALAVETTPLAPVPDAGPYTHRYASQQARFQEAEAKARLMAKTRQQDAMRTANMELYDVTFYDLNLDLNPGTQTLTGTVTVEARVLDTALAAMELHLYHNMSVSSVSTGALPLAFSHNGDLLAITLDQTYQPGAMVSVTVDYTGNPDSDYFGWDSFNGDPWIWTLSEPYGARRWWPCKDLNTDKADSVDIHVTVPDDLIVASNGLLDSETVPAPGLRTYFWKERYPIVTYLVAVTVHPFATFSNTYTGLDGVTTMPVDYYVLPAFLSDAQASYPITVDMIGAYAQAFGEYPFLNEKYGHVQFPWGGGMEHQTLTSLYHHAYSQHIISHELGHQWFGDMITCADFHHIWLNEGFATWCEAYWREVSEGEAAYREEMNDAAYLGGGTIYVEDPNNFWEIFDGNLSYNKASWVPHMLRGMLGDETFFAGLAQYRATLGYGSATTEQFRDVFEQVSGRDLDQFFQQWIYGAGHPQYLVHWAATPATGGTMVSVRIEQTQAEPVFEMPLQLKIDQLFGNQVMTVENNQRVQWYNFLVSGQVDDLQLDPNDWVLCEINYGGASGLPSMNAAVPRLLPNVPNPFNPSTDIRYELPAEAQVEVSVYDLSGRLVRVLEQGIRPAGENSVRWDGRDDQGGAQASGLYFVRLNADGKIGLRKITLVQ